MEPILPADEIRPHMLLRAYASGIFPMGEDRYDNTLHWIDPVMRGILPLDAVHVPRRLKRTVRKQPFQITVDRAFARVVLCCADSRPGRDSTWINGRIIRLYTALHQMGNAHSVECWREGRLAGGLYGVHLGRAFFGESMFSLVTDASKVALVYLIARLLAGGFILLDTQFVTEHLRQFGAREVPRAVYHAMLKPAVTGTGNFYSLPEDTLPEAILQSISQTS